MITSVDSELTLSSGAFFSLADTMPVGLLLFADDGTMLDGNATLASWLGMRRGDIARKPIDAILPPGGKIFYQTHFLPLLRANGSVNEVYFALRAADGHEIPVLISATRRSDSGPAVCLATFVEINNRQQFEGALLSAWRLEQSAREETERKSAELDQLNAELTARNQELQAAEAALESSNSAKDEFIGMVSHELKNPLTVLAGTMALLAANPIDQSHDESRQMIAGLQEEFARLLRVVDDLLIVARSELGTVDIEPVLAQRLVTTIAAQERERFPAHAIAVTIDEGVPFASASPSLVQQILLNFVSNARKYGRKDAPIEMRVAHERDRVLISVANDGEVISDDEVERFFEPFYRAERTRGRVQGVGLGLTVCQRLAEAQHATISGRPRVGGGLEIVLELPVLEDLDE